MDQALIDFFYAVEAAGIDPYWFIVVGVGVFCGAVSFIIDIIIDR